MPAEAEPTWLEELRALADALERGLPLPDPPPVPKRPTLTLIRGGRDDAR